MGLFLFIIAYLLFLPITFFNALNVRKKGYMRDSAVNLDRYANREFRFSLNKYLIFEKSPDRFGDITETISSVLGKNQQTNNLTKFGTNVANFLDSIDEEHCKKSINK